MIGVSGRTMYRNPAKALIFVVAGVYGVAMMVALFVLSDPGATDGAELALGLVLSLWAIFRLSRCGIEADEEGIRVVNPLSSPRLRWDEIQRFAIADREACRIERVDGSSVKAFGLQPSGWNAMRGTLPKREAAMVDELNARLRAHAGTRG